jgi:hypothetical protein
VSRAFSPKIVTANDLITGEVVYLAADGRWSPRHADAELLTDEAEADLRLIEAAAQEHRVVGVYLADARPGPKGPEPVHFREVFRTRGPSNYHHGKQAGAIAQT